MAQKKDDDTAVNNPKDRFFRGFLGIAKHMKQLLKWKLPQQLQAPFNWSTMRILSTTFVDERLRLRESDLLVEFRTKGNEPVLVYILWEHQSKIDPMMAWRILCYRIEIWKSWLKENPKARKFPFIHALVIYQGKGKWNAPTDFANLIDFEKMGLEQSLDSQNVSSEYGTISVVNLPETGWPEDLALRLGLSLMRAVTLNTQCNWLIEHGGDLNEVLNKPGGDAIFSQVIEYILVTEGDENKVLHALKQTPSAIERKAMSVAEQIEKRGVEKGIEKGIENLILAMFNNGASVEKIARLTGLDTAIVKAITKGN